MAPNPGQDISSNPLPSPDTSRSSTHEKPHRINKRHPSTRSYTQRQLDQIVHVQAELRKVKEECEALELYVCQLEGERDWLRGILREIPKGE